MLNRRIETAVAELAPLRGATPVHILQCSSRYASGAILLHVWAGSEQYPRVIVKTARDPRIGTSIASEWNTMHELSGDATFAGLMPAPLAHFSADGADFYAYTACPGRTLFYRFRNRVLTSRQVMFNSFCECSLPIALKLHQSRTQMGKGEEIAHDTQQDLTALREMMPKLGAQLISRAEAAIASLANFHYDIPIGRVHGDFSPFNLLTTSLRSGGTSALIDWEHYEESRPQHLDILRFISACVIMDRGSSNPAATLKAMASQDNALIANLLSPWLKALAPQSQAQWIAPEALQALWWSYWIHAARREQERALQPSDTSESLYVRGLSALQ